MKLLAIRGENLTSLAGPFEVQLAEAPLGGSGLFAITGPTGAGKSTLLDALCLALFDQVPRLDGRSRVEVGREADRLGVNDVRTLLRRGTATGFAEVDYVGRDGRKFRARWSVRRARERPDGTMQDQVLSLTEIATGQTFGRTKTEVLGEIVRTLGLSYEQFRRSALLAQGDFAAFLRASGDERGSLLEKMTGTEIYSAISRAAFARNKEVKDDLRARGDALGAVRMLSPEEREAIEARVPALEGEKVEARAHADALAGAQQWFELQRNLAGAEAQAIDAERAAEEALGALAGAREELSRVEQARALRPLRGATEEAERALTAARREREALGQRAREAEVARAHAVEELAKAEGALTAAREAREAAATEIDEAVALDAEIRDRQGRHADAAARASLAARERDATEGEVARLGAEIEDGERRAQEIAAWTAARPGHAALAEQWPRWEEALKAHAESAREARAARAAAEERAGEEARARAAHEAAEVGEREAGADAGEAHEAWRTLDEQAEAKALTAEERAEREQLVEDRRQLGPLETILAQAIALHDAEAQETERARAAREGAEHAAGEAARAEAEASRLGAACDEAERAARQARAALDLSGHRAALRPGEECPLCGAREHPYAAGGSPVAALVQDLEARERSLRRDLDAARSRAAMGRADERAHRHTMDHAVQRARTAAEQRAPLVERFQRSAPRLDLPGDEPDEAAAKAVRDRIAGGDARLEALAAKEKEAVALQKRAAAALRARDRAREAHEAAREARAQAERRAAEIAEQRRASEATAERHAQAREKAAAELDEPLGKGPPGWRERLDREPGRMLDICGKAVAEHRAKMDERAALTAALTSLRAKQEGALAQLAERERAAKDRREELAELTAILAGKRGARAALLGGRAVSEVRAALDGAIASAESALAAARGAERDRVKAAADAAAALRSAEAAHAAAEARAAEADQALARALDDAGIDRATLDLRLSRDDRWIEATERAIREAEQARVSARARREERARMREEHEASGRPALDEAAVLASLPAAQERLDRVAQALAGAQVELERDDAARRDHAKGAEELARRQKLAERWQILDDLIGSADGKKFRVFAQSLTLEALLSHANEHLGELAPRYLLSRVPHTDLDLQIVDQDMAGEVRSTSSLSGGESFLVSLSLALGLSSLAAHDVRIETLFIDEGFGTLDPETLDTALAALETLQATGRQIGLISHVSGLAEQIGLEVRVERVGGGRSRVRVVGQGVAQGAGPALVLAAPAKAAPKRRAKKASGTAA
ncbi:MAG: AAA family ATPase [Byssovorax sp.]